MASLKRTMIHMSLCLLPLGLGCADGYVPPKDTPIIIDGNNMMEPPAGSAGVEVGTPSGALIEGGSPVSVSIKLLRAPTAPVRLSLSSSNIAEGTAAPAELVFDAQDWSQAKEVTLTPGDDEIADGDKRWQLKLVISSEDATFANEQVRPLNLTTIDNDVAPQIVIMPLGAPRTTEAGGSVTVQVVLTRQPSSDVLIPVRIDDPSEASTTTTSVTLNALDWNVPHELVITGLDDMTKDGDVRYKLTLGPANSTDEAFNGIGPSSLELTNLDGVCGNGVVDGKEGCEPTSDQTQCDLGEPECTICSDACVYVPGTPTSFSAIDAGTVHTCGLLNTGALKCWGDNARGQQPSQTEMVTGLTVSGLSSCISTSAGVSCYGDAASRVELNGSIKKMSLLSFTLNTAEAGLIYHNTLCGLDDTGQVMCTESDAPDNLLFERPRTGGNVDIASAYGQACVLNASSSPNCWGYEYDPQNTPTVTMSKIASGAFSFCGIRASDGGLLCWSGDGEGFPAPPSSKGFFAIGMHYKVGLSDYGCALNASGMSCWGELPDNIPLQTAGSFTLLSVGREHVCAVKTSGEVKCWGSNQFGQLNGPSN